MTNKPKAIWQAPEKLEIRHTGNLKGDMDYLPKLGTIIKNQRKEYPNLLLLDTGNFCGDKKPGPFAGKPQVEVMNYLAFDATVPGQAEAKDSLCLKRMAKLAKFPFLASNWRGMGEDYFFKRMLKLKYMDLNIAVLGLACQEAPKDTEVITPQQALDEALKEITDLNTVIIILSQLDYSVNRALAMQGKQTKIIIEGVAYPGFTEPTTVGNSLIAPASPGPSQLGSLSVDISGAIEINKPTDDEQ